MGPATELGWALETVVCRNISTNNVTAGSLMKMATVSVTTHLLKAECTMVADGNNF
jgi:hypothetical protein